jgi:hypothetical protein
MKLVAAFSVLLFACGGSSGGDDDDGALPELPGCPEVACAAGPTITTAEELVTFVGAPEFIFFGEYTTGCLVPSPEVSVTGAITVDGADIPVPAGCTAPGCREQVLFRLNEPVAGIECLDPEVKFDYTLCARLAITDATFRIIPVLQDQHPSPDGNFVPVVDVIGACDAACASPELACAETQTCYRTARDQCAYCFDGDNTACACWNGTDFEPDGTECSFFISGDLVEIGACRSGTCVSDR